MLPYELIGKVTVGLFTILAVLLALLVAILVLMRLWVLFWRSVVNLAWYGYEVPDDPPPYKRRKVSVVAHELSRFSISNIDRKTNELEKRVPDNEDTS